MSKRWFAGGMVALAIAAGSVEAAAPGLPEGTFRGTATWTGPEASTGSYSVERVFSGDKITSRFAWTEPVAREENHAIRVVLEAAPFFDVVDESGAVVGRGYCQAQACAYRATFGPVTVDESFRWERGRLTVLGSKSGPGFAVVWTEELEAR